MKITIKIAVVVLAITTMALAPSISLYQPAKAQSNWCDNQGMSTEWVNGCKLGLNEKNNCKKYDPNRGGDDWADGYDAGWGKGMCKKL